MVVKMGRALGKQHSHAAIAINEGDKDGRRSERPRVPHIVAVEIVVATPTHRDPAAQSERTALARLQSLDHQVSRHASSSSLPSGKN